MMAIIGCKRHNHSQAYKLYIQVKQIWDLLRKQYLQMLLCAPATPAQGAAQRLPISLPAEGRILSFELSQSCEVWMTSQRH